MAVNVAKLLRNAEVMLNTSTGGGKAPFMLMEVCSASAVVVTVIVLVTVVERGDFCPRLLLAVGAITGEIAVMEGMGSVVESTVIDLTSSAGSLVASAIPANCG